MKEKADLLRGNHFLCDWKREIYYNLDMKLLVTYEALDKNPIEVLRKFLQTKGDLWHFLFSEKPDQATVAKLINTLEIDGSGLYVSTSSFASH
jgi:hypothetical protein